MGRGQRERRRLAAAANPQPSSSSHHVPGAHLSAVHPTPAACDLQPLNYVSRKQNKIENFCKYLHESGRRGQSDTIDVNYKQMMALSGLDLTIATCNDRHSRERDWLLPAARQFLKENYLGCEVGTTNDKLLDYTDFPESMQKVEDFLSEDLVETVNLFGGELSVYSATSRGRHFPLMLIAALFKHHSKGIFWNGTFSIAEMVICDYGSHSQRIKILQKPVEAHTWTKKKCDEAKVKDMHRVAELITEHYKDLPLYFPELIEDLVLNMTDEKVGKPWFREYLSYHVAFMPSSARYYLETKLYSTCANCNVYMPFMAKKPYPVDWRTRVNQAGQDYISDILHNVYSYNIKHHQWDLYDDSVRGLMKFKRNVLEHGGQYIHVEVHHLTHLELCAANEFSKFLPNLVHTLLEEGQMAMPQIVFCSRL